MRCVIYTFILSLLLALLSPNRSGLAVVEDLGLKLFDPGLELLEDLPSPDRLPVLLEAECYSFLSGLTALSDGLGWPLFLFVNLGFFDIHSI